MFKRKDPTEIRDRCVAALKSQLGNNLYSCAVYGSMVRGQFVNKQSDINLLIVLRESNTDAHKAIGQIVRDNRPVDPFTIGLKGIERTMKVFGLKFASIRRNYEILAGEDPFVNFKLDSDLDRFLVEQSLRNVRLRHVHNFVMGGMDRKRYSYYLDDITPTIFTDLSEVARLNGVTLPGEFGQRVPLLEKTFDIPLEVLTELLAHKKDFSVLTESDILNFQTKLFQVLTHVVFWIESRWELPIPRGGA